MNFVESVQQCFRKYIDFSGRAPRSEYWWFFLFTFIVQMLAVFLNDTLGNLIALVLILPTLAVTVRRLHDIGKSGWWILISLIPLIGFIVIVYFAVQPSQPGANEYGPPPVEAT